MVREAPSLPSPVERGRGRKEEGSAGKNDQFGGLAFVPRNLGFDRRVAVALAGAGCAVKPIRTGYTREFEHDLCAR
jgi:hypothetical protein